MFDFDNSGLDSLELGSRRRPVKWAVELSLADCRPQKHKARRRQQAAQQAAEQEQKQQHALLQQQAQQQKVAAQRKHLEQLAQLQQQDRADVTPAQAKHRKEFRDSSVVCLSTEIEQGNVEYKYRLTGCVTNENRRHQLVTQMKFRLSEGSGECFYYLGVEDDGYPRGLEAHELHDSIAVIHRMAASLHATARLVEYIPGGFGRTAALLHIKKNATEDMRVTDSRIAVAGSMDSGKSTLVAVLTHGADGRPLLDNGRGSARMAVFRHKHEIESGRTSSISQQVLGYDEEGRVLNYVGVATPTPADITAAATHMVNFIDMGGHEKYLKTTLYGMTCLLPDYALLCVDALTGITRITREHLAVAVALEVPTALVITKADAVDEAQLQQLISQLELLMQPVLHSSCQVRQHGEQHGAAARGMAGSDSSSTCSSSSDSGSDDDSSYSSSSSQGMSQAGDVPGVCAQHVAGGRGVPVVGCETQAVALASSLSELHSCTAAPAAPSFQQVVFPVFVTSCVTGAGVPLLHAFLSHLKPLQHSTQGGTTTTTAGADTSQPSGATDLTSTGCAHTTRPEVSASQVQQQQHLHQRPGHQQQQQPQPHMSPGVRPAAREGSSQLWGVPSSPPHQQQQARPGAATGVVAAEPSCAAVPGTCKQQGSGCEGDSCRPGHFQVVHTYDVEGVGWVVSGIAVTGTIEVGQSLLWGPTPEGGFSPVRVTCIQRSHIPVRQIAPGQTATLALQPTAAGLPHSGSRQALLTAAAVAQAAAAEAAAREAAAAIAAVPEPVAKTRRRSPAALKAAAAAAASTAATAAAAAAAARRAAETAEGRPWWLLPDKQGHEADRDDPAAAGGDGAAGQQVRPAGCMSPTHVEEGRSAATTTAAAAAADGVADLLDDDFAADLAADDDGSDSDVDLGLFGADLDQPQQHSSRQHLGGSMRCSGVEAVTGGLADDDIFDGLGDVFGNDEQDETQLRMQDSTSGSSSSGSGSGLSGNWSFSSSSSDGSSGGSNGQADSGAQAEGQPDATMVQAAVVDWAVRGSSPSAGDLLCMGCSPSRWRNKGGVLLDAAAAPHTYWEFEVLLVLLGGYWPPRGLLSGCWPPGETAAAAGEVAGGEPNDGSSNQLGQQDSTHQQQQQGRKQRSGRESFEFAYVIHCNSIRQMASVVCMRELREGSQAAHTGQQAAISSSNNDSQEPCASDPNAAQQQQLVDQHCGLTVSIRAAAALLQDASSAAASDKEEASGCVSGDSSGDSGTRRQRRLGSSSAGGCSRGRSGVMRRGREAGSVVSVRFKFSHRPEWMQVGARLIVRDRSDGHVAAAGFVTQLLQPHTAVAASNTTLSRHTTAGRDD